jgi:RHS repeat-associated protein
MKAYQGTVSSGVWTAQNTQTFASAYKYDFNGNITELQRYAGVTQIDDLEYFYNHDNHTAKTGLVSNKLYLVDEQSTHTGGNDLKQGSLTGAGFDPNDDATWNYDYDPIGNLVQDKNEKIDQILWTVTGKVSDVIFEVDLPNNSYNLAFRYDPMGNRIAKIVKPHASLANCTTWTVTWYARDAQGNVLAVYSKPEDSLNLRATEFNIYGSSRIGMVTQPEALSQLTNDTLRHTQTLGYKVYEFSNHLGNVLTTFSDRKIAVENISDQGHVAWYTSEILSSTDYYPFGMPMPGRNFVGGYRYGFQGQEGDPEIRGEGNSWNYTFRMHDPRIGRFFAIDPLFDVYPFYSPYAFSGNRVIDMVEEEGLQPKKPKRWLKRIKCPDFGGSDIKQRTRCLAEQTYKDIKRWAERQIPAPPTHRPQTPHDDGTPPDDETPPDPPSDESEPPKRILLPPIPFFKIEFTWNFSLDQNSSGTPSLDTSNDEGKCNETGEKEKEEENSTEPKEKDHEINKKAKVSVKLKETEASKQRRERYKQQKAAQDEERMRRKEGESESNSSD